MTPFFSIIIPLYNSWATLQLTLDSITGQTFKNYELVLIDGGSTDGTGTIIHHLKEVHKGPIRSIAEPDQGIYDAMNKGVDLASGRWLYFMGGDDVFASMDILQQVFQVLENEKADLIYGNVTGAISKTRYADGEINSVLSRGIHHQGIFYKKEVFDHTGKYSLNFKVAADYHLTLKIFCNPAFKKKYIDADIARFGETGLSSTLYDYRFYSYHYRFLATHAALDQLDDRMTCLEKSIYCCLWLVKSKQSMRAAWANAIYYIADLNNGLSFIFRLRTFLRMANWSLRPTV